MLWWILGAACAADPPPPPTALQLEGATLIADDGSALRMASATIGRDGAGEGQQVSARSAGAPPLAINAPTSDWDLKGRVARFTGGVTATRADVTLTCQTLTVSFASADRVRQATCEGAVTVTQGARRAEGSRAELDADSGEIVLTGEPVISEGSNRMRGERITLWLDDERVRCEQCSLIVDGEAVRPR